MRPLGTQRAIRIATMFAAVGLFMTLPARHTFAQTCGEYQKYRHKVIPNPYPTGGTIGGHYWYCPDPTVIGIFEDRYRCADDTVFASNGPYPIGLPGYCVSTDAALIAAKPNGAYARSSCDSECAAPPTFAPGLCDGKEAGALALIDEACGDDEHRCTSTFGLDAYPANLSSGRVESLPLELFSVPAPEGIAFSLNIKYYSHLNAPPAIDRTGGGAPTIRHSDERRHFLGLGWIDSFGDRLMISVRGLKSTTRTWVSLNGIVTFVQRDGVWSSTSGKYELIERGTTDGKWMIRTTDTHAPRRIWLFDELSYISLEGAAEKIGRLRRTALTAAGSDAQGTYGYDLVWSSSGTLSKVIDTLGRTLSFTYYGGQFYPSLASVSYSPTPTGAPATIAAFHYYSEAGNPDERRLLDRVVLTGSGSYRRFLYWHSAPETCLGCSDHLTDVIANVGNITSSPLAQSPPGATEVALEHHDYTATIDGSRSLVVGTAGPIERLGYEWDQVYSSGIQYDLHQPDPIGRV